MPKLAERLFEFICTRRGLSVRFVALSMAVLVSSGAVEQRSAGAPRAIRVAFDENYPPYSFRSDDGKLQGILIDQWLAWEKKTGVKVEFHAMDWSEALRRMRAGEFDVIAAIAETAARREYFDFSPAFATMEVPIFFRKNISAITDIASLKGFAVGVREGDQYIDILKTSGVTDLITFPNHAAIVDAAKKHKINLFMFCAPSAHYHLSKAGIEDDFRQSQPVFRNEVRRAVQKGDTKTLRLMAAGFAAVGPGELARIEEKWFGRTANRYGRDLAYVGWVGAVALLLVGSLAMVNRTLRNNIQQRTAALRESEQRFRQIAENIHEIVWLTTVDLSKALYVSPAYEVVWGRSCESFYQAPRSFIASIHPDDRARVVEVIDENRERGFNLEYRIVRPDGSTRWIWDRGFPIRDDSGRAYRIAGITKDITERKLAADSARREEARVRLIIDTMPTMAWSVQPDGSIDFLNQRWLDYAGLTLEAYAKDPLLVMHLEDVPRVTEKWLATMAAGEPYEDEMRLRRADGAYRWFLVRTAPLRDERGNIVKWFGSSVDIEDRKAAMEALRSSERQLQALVRRLHTVREEEAKRIARELHDDLGQKLTALNMELADLELKLTETTPGQRDQITRMHATVDQTVDLVQELSSELRLGQLDVLGLTAAIEWELKEFSRRSRIPCNVTRLDEVTHLSDAQSTTVFRILQEALTNIIRHAGATLVEISLQARPDQLALRIHDNGRGVTTAEMNDRKAIGLLGMYERAQSIGGAVAITGATGQGTTVLVTIPLISA